MESVRARIARHDSELGSWEMAVAAPAPRLAPYVQEYHGYIEHDDGFSRRLQVPSTSTVLVINFGPKYRIMGPGNVDGPNEYGSFVAGLVDAHVIVEGRGANRGLQVNFTALGARSFFGLPMSELTNRIVHFDDVLGPDAGGLVAKLEDTPDWDARFALLDAVIEERLSSARPPAPGIAWALRRLSESGGRIEIASLAEGAGWSRKHLVERFRAEVGLPPKTLARIMRFQTALRSLDGRNDVSWSEIALQCGYYDQAHFNRDFRAFTGSTPADYVRRLIPGGGVLGD